MKHKAVIGVGFGDEGKGVTVSSLSKQSKPTETLVVRYSGGQQAGHTVVHNGITHVFSNFGSATMQGVPTLWSEYCSFDPVGVMNEYNILIEKGFKPKLYVSPDCPITTPYEKFISHTNMLHGTCGVGVGNTFQREEDFYSLKTRDMLFRSIFQMKYDLLDDYYTDLLDSKENTEFLNAVQFVIDCEDIIIIKNTNYNLFDIEENINTIIYESSQGLLLDQHYGFFPHVTRADLGVKNIQKIAHQLTGKKFDIDIDIELFLITRAYQTRHGNGPMTNEDVNHNIKDNQDETNVTNSQQGIFRKSILDLDLIKYALMVDPEINKNLGSSTIVITNLDQVEDNWQYSINQKIYNVNTEYKFISDIYEYLKVFNYIKINSPNGF